MLTERLHLNPFDDWLYFDQLRASQKIGLRIQTVSRVDNNKSNMGSCCECVFTPFLIIPNASVIFILVSALELYLIRKMRLHGLSIDLKYC